ncbi:MAG: tetratricopeptide repeat protein, partial [Armatimonadota bacterium]
RYRMLETIGHYSRERLRESGEGGTLLRRHLEWHLGLAEQAEPALRGPDQVIWLDRLELDYDDFRAALEWARAEGADVEAGARLAGALHRFWALRGYLREGRAWLEGTVAQQSVSAPVRARAVYGAGMLAFHQGDFARAEALCHESLALYREQDDALGVVLSLNILASLTRNRGDYRQAMKLLEESLKLCRQSGQTWALADTLNILGVTARRQGDLERATAMFSESLALWRQLGDKSGLATSLGHLGVVARQQGDYERARTLHEESLILRRQLGDKRNVAAALSSLGAVALYRGDLAQAGALFEESLALSRELGDKLSTAATVGALGFVVYRQGDDGRATGLLQESLALARELGDKLNSAAALCNLGFVAFRRSDYEQAAAFHRESLMLYRELGDTLGIIDCMIGRARVAAVQEQAELGARLLAAVETLRTSSGVLLPHSDRADYEQAIAAVRAHLSDDAFAAAWAEGQVMPLDQALKDAMR